MNGFDVDPDSLVAASELARRQQGHLARIESYISSACSQTGAFTGVMDLFQSSYESALQSAGDGMRDAQAVAGKAARSFRVSARAYEEADRAAFERMERLFGEAGSLRGYVPAGSGNTEPGGPINAPLEPTGAGEGDPLDHQSVPDWVKGLASAGAKDALHDSDKPDMPGATKPLSTLGDHVRETVLSNIKRGEYMSLRDQGLSHEDAMKQLFPSANDRAIANEDLRNRDEAQRNWNEVYEQRAASGADEGTARQAADDARDTTRAYQDEDRRQRENVERHGRNAKGVHDGLKGMYDGVKEAGESVAGIGDNLEDAERYDDYLDDEQDRSAQEWAGR